MQPVRQKQKGKKKNGDPRRSIEERYKDHNDYLKQVNRAARIPVDERFLLHEDAERIIAGATKANLFADKNQSTKSGKAINKCLTPKLTRTAACYFIGSNQ
jgi:hypothetical protein